MSPPTRPLETFSPEQLDAILKIQQVLLEPWSASAAFRIHAAELLEHVFGPLIDASLPGGERPRAMAPMPCQCPKCGNIHGNPVIQGGAS
jgi:hypothetical protein